MLRPPAPVTEALKRLNQSGFEAYLVGGCVRDAYLGKTPKDYDITTNALPEEMRCVFSGVPSVDTGIKHGTLTVLMDHMPIEITTYRVDGEYTDGRRPDTVLFTRSLREDLLRRDFTINAMAWHPDTGLVDFMGGREDCDRRLIRAVGKPEKRFSEDALRILRGFRFAAVLGFSIAPKTFKAMERLAESLNKVSRERVACELNAAMKGEFIVEALRAYPRMMLAALPELNPMLHCPQRSVFHMYDVWEHTLHAIQHTPPDLVLRWAALFHDSGKPACATYDPDGTTHFRGHPQVSARLAVEAFQSLKQPKALTEELRILVKYHDDRIGPDNLQQWLVKLGYELCLKMLLLQKADMAAHAPQVALRVPQIDELRVKVEELMRHGACLKVRDLAVNGLDLIALGYAEGERLGVALRCLFEEVTRNRLPNEKEALLQEARKWLKAGERD